MRKKINSSLWAFAALLIVLPFNNCGGKFGAYKSTEETSKGSSSDLGSTSPNPSPAPAPAPAPGPAPGPAPAPAPAPMPTPMPTGMPVLDAYPNATAAYSFRKLRTAYAGPAVQIRRASDNTTLNVGFSPTNGLDVNAASAFCATTNCFVVKFYDQSGSANDLAQAVAANQPQYIFNGSPNANPVARWCATCGMRAPDSVVYKSNKVNAFMVVKIGTPQDGQPPKNWIVGYPRTATSDLTDAGWGLSNQGYADIMQVQVYAAGAGYNNGSENPYGFGAAYRGRLFQYDIDSSTRSFKYNGALFRSGTAAPTISYPNSVGLTVGMDAKGTSNMLNGEFSELILYSSTQAGRDTISANQSSYWGIQNPPATVTTADGVQWTPYYTGNFSGAGGPNAGKFNSVNGRNYYTEGSWDTYSLWKANLANGRDMYRFETRIHDQDNITGAERSELDGAAAASFPADATVQISYAVLVEPGNPIIGSSWVSLGQYHYDNAVYPPTSFAIGLQNDEWSVEKDDVNPVSVYKTGKITRNRWYNFFIEQKISANGTSDVLKVWIDGAQVVNSTGALFPHGKQGGYWKYGIYRGYVIAEPIAVRYANMEVTNKASSDISARITTPIAHP